MAGIPVVTTVEVHPLLQVFCLEFDPTILFTACLHREVELFFQLSSLLIFWLIVVAI
jgi:hypothetical protein